MSIRFPGKLVKKETYAEEYEAEIKKTGVPFFPKAISKDLVFCGLRAPGHCSSAPHTSVRKVHMEFLIRRRLTLRRNLISSSSGSMRFCHFYRITRRHS